MRVRPDNQLARGAGTGLIADTARTCHVLAINELGTGMPLKVAHATDAAQRVGRALRNGVLTHFPEGGSGNSRVVVKGSAIETKGAGAHAAYAWNGLFSQGDIHLAVRNSNLVTRGGIDDRDQVPDHADGVEAVNQGEGDVTVLIRDSDIETHGTDSDGVLARIRSRASQDEAAQGNVDIDIRGGSITTTHPLAWGIFGFIGDYVTGDLGIHLEGVTPPVQRPHDAHDARGAPPSPCRLPRWPAAQRTPQTSHERTATPETTMRTPSQTGALAAATAAVLLNLSASASAETVLRVATHAGLSGLDPIWTTAYITRNHGYMVYDTLFAVDETFEVKPQMVDTWEVSDDGRVYTFTLRDGLTWHDGDPVTAEDCTASIERWGTRDALGQRLMRHVESLEARDDRTFTIKLSRPYARVLASLGKLDSNTPFMMKREHAAVSANTELTEEVGSGPFRFVAEEWKPGQTAAYVRNEAYVPRAEPASGTAGAKIAQVDRVEWIYFRKPNDARRALVRGKVDIWENPPPSLTAKLKRHREIVVEVLDPVGLQGSIRMNHLRPPFDDPKVRLAFALAVDQREYLKAVVGTGAEDRYDACPSFFTCSREPVLAGSETLATVDLDRAKALLDASSYRGERIVLLNPKDFHHLDAAAKVTAKTLRRIGMKVKVDSVSWNQLSERRANRGKRRGWHLFPTAFNGLTAASPLTNIGIRTGDDAWFGWPTDDAVPGLIEAYAEAADPGTEREALTRLSERLFEVLPYINFGQWSAPVAYRTGVSGLITAPIPIYWHVTKNN